MASKKTQPIRSQKQKDAPIKVFVRIFCLFLAVLMILGTLYYTFYFLAHDVAALDYTMEASNPLMASGIQYGSGPGVSGREDRDRKRGTRFFSPLGDQ